MTQQAEMTEIDFMDTVLTELRTGEREPVMSDARMFGYMDGCVADCEVSALYTPLQGEWDEYLGGFIEGARQFGRTAQAEAAQKLMQTGILR